MILKEPFRSDLSFLLLLDYSRASVAQEELLVPMSLALKLFDEFCGLGGEASLLLGLEFIQQGEHLVPFIDLRILDLLETV